MTSRLADRIVKLHHINIGAPLGSHKKIRDFYGNVMGLEEIQPPKHLTELYDIMWFKILDICFFFQFTPHFKKSPDLANHIAFEVKNLKEFKRDLKGKGVEIEEAVEKTDQDRFYMTDPVGNRFEFLEMHNKK